MPAVSVIIACYNGEKVIRKAIDSVLAQTLQNFEILVVDDGSTDASVDFVAKTYPDGQVRVLKHAQNRGISAARNTGIRAAKGDFICFLDQDDLWYPDRLASALEVFDQDTDGNVGLVFGNEETRTLETSTLVPGRLPAPNNANALERDAFLSALILRNFIPTAAAMMRRACFNTLGLLDETITSGIDDFELFLRVARAYDVRHVSKVQAIRHVHAGNFTKLARMIPEALVVLDRISVEEPAVAKVAHRARAHYLYLLSREQHKNREFVSAIATMWQAIKSHPFDLKSWFALLLTFTGPVGHALFETSWMRPERHTQT